MLERGTASCCRQTGTNDLEQNERWSRDASGAKLFLKLEIKIISADLSFLRLRIGHRVGHGKSCASHPLSQSALASIQSSCAVFLQAPPPRSFLPFLLYAPFLLPIPIYLLGLSVQAAAVAVLLLASVHFLQGKSHQINDHLRAPAAAMAATNLTSLDQFSFAPVEGVELVDPDKDAVYSARFGGEEGYLVCLRTDGV